MSSPLYIDPTTGGLGLQILLGFFVGGFVTIKLMWGRFLSMLPWTKSSSESEDETAVPSAQVPVESGVED